MGACVAELPVDILLAIGEASEAMAEEATARAAERGRKLSVYSFRTKEEGQEKLFSLLRSGDAVLLKGSRGMGLDTVAKALRER